MRKRFIYGILALVLIAVGMSACMNNASQSSNALSEMPELLPDTALAVETSPIEMQTQTWREAYVGLLQGLWGKSFVLCDIDGDWIPELLVGGPSTETDKYASYDVYRYNNHKIEYLGEVGTLSKGHLWLDNDSGILGYSYGAGQGETHRYYIVDSALCYDGEISGYYYDSDGSQVEWFRDLNGSKVIVNEETEDEYQSISNRQIELQIYEITDSNIVKVIYRGDKSAEDQSDIDSEATGRYQINVPWVDYSTESYKVDIRDISTEVTMPLHTNRTELTNLEKEMYLLGEYQEDFYFGSEILKTTYYTLVEIYPENRSTPFYFYQIQSFDGSFSDKGIIDHSPRVNINQLFDLVWFDIYYGPNANILRVFNVGENPEISKMIVFPRTYDIYTDYYSNDHKDLVTYCTYENGNIIVKVIDIFNEDNFSYTIDREIAELCSPKFLNGEEVYIEYELYELDDKRLVKEIVNFKNNSGKKIHSETAGEEVYGKRDYPLLDMPIRYNQSEVILVIANNINYPDRTEYLVTDNRNVLDDMQTEFYVTTFPVDRGTTPDSVVYIFEDKALTKKIPIFDIYDNERNFDLKTMSQRKVEELIEQELPPAY